MYRLFVFGILVQHLVCLFDAELARLRDVEATLARILHKDLYQASVVVGFGKVGVEFDGARIVLVGLGELSRNGVQICSVVVRKREVGVELYRFVQIGYSLIVVICTRRVVFQSVRRVGVDGNSLVRIVD